MLNKHRLINLTASLLLATSSIIAQAEKGSLVGVVTDIQGGLIVNAEVYLESSETRHKTATDKNGVFNFSRLPIDTYTLTIQKGNFKIYRQTDLIITARNSELTITLDVNIQKENVDVPENQTKADINNPYDLVLNKEEIDNLPDETDELQSLLKNFIGETGAPDGGQYTLMVF